MNNSITLTEAEKMRLYMALLSEETLNEGVLDTIVQKVKDLITSNPILGKVYDVIKNTLGDEIMTILKSDASGKEKFEQLKSLGQQNKELFTKQASSAGDQYQELDRIKGYTESTSAVPGLVGAHAMIFMPLILKFLDQPITTNVMNTTIGFAVFFLICAIAGLFSDIKGTLDMDKRRNANLMGRT